MQRLDKLKDVWQNQAESHIKFSEKEIYEMVHKRSSSIVKWILLISILEFVLPNTILLFTDHGVSSKIYETYNLQNIINIYTIIHIGIIIGFIYYFYKNYKNISAESSVKKLLYNILKTRKTVKYYIYYNLTMAAIIGVHVFYKVFNSDQFADKLPENINLITVWFVAIVLFSMVLVLFWYFYRIVYGYFLKKLKNNYSELSNNT